MARKNFEQLSLFSFNFDERPNLNDLHDTNTKLFKEWLHQQDDKELRILQHVGMFYWDFCEEDFGNIKQYALSVKNSKCYHFGSLEKNWYIYSLQTKSGYLFFFKNSKHTVCISDTYENLNDVLAGKEALCFAACGVKVFDNNGEIIEKYRDNIKDDIRQQVIIDEWHFEKFSHNRIYPGEKVNYFYEVKFTIQELLKYYEKEK